MVARLSEKLLSLLMPLISASTLTNSRTIFTATSTPRIDALFATGVFSTASLFWMKTQAPAPYGPGLLLHDPSVNANIFSTS